jgi:hypothetical protein
VRALGFVFAFAAVVIGGFAVVPASAQPNSILQARQSTPVFHTGIGQEIKSARQQAIPDAQQSGSGPLLFLPVVNYYTGVSYALAVVDVNGDGKPDIIACGGGMSVLLGNGDGTFQPAVTYPSGGNPFSFAVGDLNHDGKPDLIAANADTAVVGVLLGNGDGTFRPVVTYPSGGYLPMGIGVGDLNNDGHQDVVVINEPALSVLLGNGDGTLQAAAIVGGVSGYPDQLVIGDANGDGNLDVFIPFEATGDADSFVRVLLGSGDGKDFAGSQYGWKGSGPITAAAIADFNGDGYLDMVATNYGDRPPSQVGVFLGNGDGTFQSALTFNTQLSTQSSVAVADVDRDGHPDLIVASFGTALALLKGNGDGSFQGPVLYDSRGGWLHSVMAGDVNGDGLPDVLVANSGSNAVGVFLNNSAAPPSTTSLTSSVNPVDIKKTVTYTAKVTNKSGGTLNGIVDFKDGTGTVATVTLSNNQAAFSTSYIRKQLGAHSITATYGGEYQVATGSVSPPLTEYVRGTLSKTTLASSGSPSHVGQSVTFTATVTAHSGKVPDGETVTFTTGKTVLGMGSTSNGSANLTTSFSKAKTYTIKATYAGDDVFEPSAGTFKQIVDP